MFENHSLWSANVFWVLELKNLWPRSSSKIVPGRWTWYFNYTVSVPKLPTIFCYKLAFVTVLVVFGEHRKSNNPRVKWRRFDLISCRNVQSGNVRHRILIKNDKIRSSPFVLLSGALVTAKGLANQFDSANAKWIDLERPIEEKTFAQSESFTWRKLWELIRPHLFYLLCSIAVSNNFPSNKWLIR